VKRTELKRRSWRMTAPDLAGHCHFALLEHDPEKVADFSDKIMRQRKDIGSAIDSIRNDGALDSKTRQSTAATASPLATLWTFFR
jgi:hypothetical protein